MRMFEIVRYFNFDFTEGFYDILFCHYLRQSTYVKGLSYYLTLELNSRTGIIKNDEKKAICEYRNLTYCCRWQERL